MAGDDGKHGQHEDKARAGQAGDHAAPGHDRQQGRHRPRGDHAAECRHCQQGGRDRGQPFGRKPQAPRRDAAGQAGGHADADQEPAHSEAHYVRGRNVDEPAEGGDGQQCRDHAARAVEVQRQPQRQLGQREGDEESTGHEAELGRAEAELVDQCRRDHRIVDAQRVVQRGVQQEGREEQQGAARRQSRIGRALSHGTAAADAASRPRPRPATR